MDKKIVLVVPNFRWRNSMENILWHYIPYGLCMLAAVVENQYKVKIIDAYKENLSEQDFIRKIEAAKPDVVGITVLMDYFGQTMHKAAELVKFVNSNIKIIAGGVYATTNIDKVIADTNIDYLIAGEGEHTFPILLKHIFEKNKIEEEGVYYKSKGLVVGTGRCKLIENLDELPLPAYHLINLEEYISEVSRNSTDRPSKLPYAEVFTSRGCPYHCCFCQVNYIIGRKFRARSASNVLAEIDWLIEKYKIKSVIFLDDNFLIDKQRAIDIMNGLLERNLEWKMIATAVFLLDDELLELMSKSGCKYIDIAVESGTYRILHEVIHKPIKSFERVIELVRKAQALGIFVAANFIVGFPTETWNEIRSSLEFAEKLNADYTKIFNAIPLPHTELYEEANRLGCLIDGYNSENIDWKAGFIQTNEFSAADLLILRAYEWDRINFTDSEKRIKIAKMMNTTEVELKKIRQNTRDSVKKILG